VLSSGLDDGEQIRDERILELHPARDLLHTPELGERDHRLEPGKLRGRGVVSEHGGFVDRRRVTDREAHEEAVELGLRQRMRAVLLERILCGHHEERPRQAMRDPVDGDGSFTHRLEERRLGLGAGSVHLVREDDVREDRARLEGEATGGAPVVHLGDGRSEHIAREQIARELDPPEFRIDRARQGLGERRLAHPGHVLEEQMAAGDQRLDRATHDLGLPAQRSLHVRSQARGLLRCPLRRQPDSLALERIQPCLRNHPHGIPLSADATRGMSTPSGGPAARSTEPLTDAQLGGREVADRAQRSPQDPDCARPRC
jgi:hypothetical protein